MPEVNNSEMVRYRGGSALPQTKSRRLIPTSTTESFGPDVIFAVDAVVANCDDTGVGREEGRL